MFHDHQHPQKKKTASKEKITGKSMIYSPFEETPSLYTGTEIANNKEFLSRFQVSLPSAITSLASRDDNNPLGIGYQPTDWDVVCGRGKGSYNKPGNKRFREIVKEHMSEYMGARTKFDKSTVLQNIIDIIREQNNGTARFIKQNKDGSWYEISEDAAREKVGHTLRESIAARDAAPAKARVKKVVQKKQNDLLAQQQAIFNEMVSITPENSDRSTTPIPLSSFATADLPQAQPLLTQPMMQPMMQPNDRQWQQALELEDLDIDAVAFATSI